MAYQLATAFVSVQAKNGLTAAFSQIKSQVGSLLSGIGNISPVLGAVAGFAGLTYAISNAMGAAEEAINAEARLNAIIRATGNAARLSADEVLDMSKKLQSTGIFASTDITKATTALLQMRAITRESFPEIIKLSQDVAAAGFGTVETAARTLGRAMADPARGLFRLRSIGIQFTKAEQDKIRSLAETNNLLGAQRIILDKLRDSIGGTTEALAKTPAGQWMQIKHQLADISEEIGKHILPVAVEIGKAVLKITQYIQPLVTWVIDLNKRLDGWPAVIALAVAGITVLVTGVSSLVVGVTAVGGALATVIGFISSFALPVIIAAAAFAAMVAGAVALVNYLSQFPKVTQAWNDLMNSIVVASLQIWNGIKEIAAALYDVVYQLIPGWISGFSLVNGVVYVLEGLSEAITVVGAVLKTVFDLAAIGWEYISRQIKVFYDGLAPLIENIVRFGNIFVAALMDIGYYLSPVIHMIGMMLDGLTEIARVLAKISGLDVVVDIYAKNKAAADLDKKMRQLNQKREATKPIPGGAGGPSGLNGGVLNIAPGLSGLQDAWKNVQEALLKKESPMERAANGIESLDDTADRMLDELAKLNSKFNGNGPVVAGV